MESQAVRLGAAVRAGRRVLSLSQEELAAACQITSSTVRMIEKGVSSHPASKTTNSIERTLGWPAGSAAAFLVASGTATAPATEPRPAGDAGMVGETWLSTASWDLLRSAALREQRNVNAILLDAMYAYDKIFASSPRPAETAGD